MKISEPVPNPTDGQQAACLSPLLHDVTMNIALCTCKSVHAMEGQVQADSKKERMQVSVPTVFSFLVLH